MHYRLKLNKYTCIFLSDQNINDKAQEAIKRASARTYCWLCTYGVLRCVINFVSRNNVKNTCTYTFSDVLITIFDTAIFKY